MENSKYKDFLVLYGSIVTMTTYPMKNGENKFLNFKNKKKTFHLYNNNIIGTVFMFTTISLSPSCCNSSPCSNVQCCV